MGVSVELLDINSSEFDLLLHFSIHFVVINPKFGNYTNYPGLPWEWE